MRPIGTPKQLQQRRRQALKLLRRGGRPIEIAQLVGVTARSLRRWRQEAKDAAHRVQSARRPPGRPCRLNPHQLKRLQQALARGSVAYGYPADYWTLERAGWLIRKKFDVRYQSTGVWRLLRRMTWSCQRPQRRAFQRDDAAIAYWKRYRWPWIKKVADPSRNPCFPRRKWQIAGLSTQAHLGPARSNADDPHQFAASTTGELDRRVVGHAQSASDQVAREVV